jgi:hypothetical protein
MQVEIWTGNQHLRVQLKHINSILTSILTSDYLFKFYFHRAINVTCKHHTSNGTVVEAFIIFLVEECFIFGFLAKDCFMFAAEECFIL